MPSYRRRADPPELDGAKPRRTGQGVEAYVRPWQGVGVLLCDVVQLTEVDTATQGLVLLGHEYNIRGPGAFRRLDYPLFQHVLHVLANHLLMSGRVSS